MILRKSVGQTFGLFPALSVLPHGNNAINLFQTCFCSALSPRPVQRAVVSGCRVREVSFSLTGCGWPSAGRILHMWWWGGCSGSKGSVVLEPGPEPARGEQKLCQQKVPGSAACASGGSCPWCPVMTDETTLRNRPPPLPE